jgi:hypothetical protein
VARRDAALLGAVPSVPDLDAERQGVADTGLGGRNRAAVVPRGAAVPRLLRDAFLAARLVRADGSAMAGRVGVAASGPVAADYLRAVAESFRDAVVVLLGVAPAGRAAEQFFRARPLPAVVARERQDAVERRPELEQLVLRPPLALVVVRSGEQPLAGMSSAWRPVAQAPLVEQRDAEAQVLPAGERRRPQEQARSARESPQS